MKNNTAWKKFRKNKVAFAALLLIGFSIFVALFAYFIAPDHSPFANRMVVELGGRKAGHTQTFLLINKEKPVEKASWLKRLINGEEDAFYYIPIESCSVYGDSIVVEKYVDDGITETQKYIGPPHIVTRKFLLGTDSYGRDILSRLIVGVRVSLSVGLITVLISLTIGVLLGALAGYFGGRVDDAIMWFTNVIWSIPTLLLVFAITLVLGKGFWQVFVAVGLTMWVNVARTVRGQVLAAREMQYAEAAKILGFSDSRIIFRHILPNITGPILVIAAANFASAIVIEAGLSFLGVGVQAPQPSWGLMIKENYNFIITDNPMLAVFPGLAIILLVLAFNLVGNGLRDALSVK
ncbi:MAG TPA: ABC transporter permease [Parasegetibacter sp.]